MTVRRRRTPGPLRVAVTGGATGLGAALLERLGRRSDLEVLVGLDDEPGGLDGVVWRCGSAPVAERMAGVTTLVHLDLTYDATAGRAGRRARNVDDTAALLAAARDAGVRRVVLLADHAGRTGLSVAVLRPVAVVGGALGAAYDGALLHPLAGSRLLAVRGVEPLWQLCHVEDLLSALELAAVSELTGPVVVASAGHLTQREVEQCAGRRRLELPAAVAMSTAERLHRLGVTPGSPSELDRLRHPLVLRTDRLAAAGWTPAWTSAAALAAHLELRAGSGRSPLVGAAAAGATAAGATAALTVTAALVRRARARRRR